MGNFIAIYKMLKILELSLDLKESSIESLSKDGEVIKAYRRK